MENSIRINIGCGLTPTNGWRNFDNSWSFFLARIPLLPKLLYKFKLLEASQYKAILQCTQFRQVEYGDATKGLPLSTGSVEALYSSHMLEHLDQIEAAAFLKEAKRVLRSGGIIRLAVPDIRQQVQQYIESGDADTFIASTGLCEPHPRAFMQRLKMLFVGPRRHQWMYDGNSLCKLLLSQSVYVEAKNPLNMVSS
jgi:predicted SAM-dependent methyltransferase